MCLENIFLNIKKCFASRCSQTIKATDFKAPVIQASTPSNELSFRGSNMPKDRRSQQGFFASNFRRNRRYPICWKNTTWRVKTSRSGRRVTLLNDVTRMWDEVVRQEVWSLFVKSEARNLLIVMQEYPSRSTWWTTRILNPSITRGLVSFYNPFLNGLFLFFQISIQFHNK